MTYMNTEFHDGRLPVKYPLGTVYFKQQLSGTHDAIRTWRGGQLSGGWLGKEGQSHPPSPDKINKNTRQPLSLIIHAICQLAGLCLFYIPGALPE